MLAGMSEEKALQLFYPFEGYQAPENFLLLPIMTGIKINSKDSKIKLLFTN